MSIGPRACGVITRGKVQFACQFIDWKPPLGVRVASKAAIVFRVLHKKAIYAIYPVWQDVNPWNRRKA